MLIGNQPYGIESYMYVTTAVVSLCLSPAIQRGVVTLLAKVPDRTGRIGIFYFGYRGLVT